MTAPAKTLPILESGDRLTRDEFHRRYRERPDIKKAELVNGVVYVGGRVRVDHAEAHAKMVGWLGVYSAKHTECHVGDSGTVRLAPDSEVQPDACVCRWEAGGPRIDDEDFVDGAPQLIVEVAASSASYDLHDKKEAYRRAGVHEYVVWRVMDGAIDWLRLRDGEYVLVAPDARGVIESEAFPGLRLNWRRCWPAIWPACWRRWSRPPCDR
jgi:Uma2 family endonuclease